MTTISTPVSIPPGTTEVYVSFSAEINANTTESLIAMLASCVNAGVKKITLLMSSPGGSVMHGMNLYNVLRALTCELHTHNVGNVDSIGNAVFLSGATRYACPHTTFMFHGVGFDITTATRLEEKQLKESLATVEASHKRIGDVISDRTHLKGKDVSDLFLEAQTKDATYAVGCGIIDEIRDVEVPAGVPVLSLVFQR